MRSIKTIIISALLAAAPFAANADPIHYVVDGVFDTASTTTPGVAGDTFRLTVTIDSATVGSAFGGGTVFGGGIASLIVAGATIFDGVAGFVSQNCCGAGTLQIGLFVPDIQFSPFFEGLTIPDHTVLTDPQFLAAQGVTGFADEFLMGQMHRAGSAVLVPEPDTLALFGLALAGLGLARRRKNG